MKVRFAVSAGFGPPDPSRLADWAASAEATGFDSLWFSDVPMVPGADPLLAVATVAARTSKLRLGTNLVPFGYHPFVFARQVAQLDRLTGGRLLVTLVPGLAHAGERAALGTVGADRGRLLDELLPQLRSWWAGETVALGPDAEPVALPVLPRQSPLEVWLAGTGPRALERAGRLADGWLGTLMSPADAAATRARIDDAAVSAGRTIDPEHFGLSLPYLRRSGDLPLATGPAKVPIPVGAAALRTLVEGLVAEGISKFVVRSTSAVAPEDEADELAWLADALLDLQT